MTVSGADRRDYTIGQLAEAAGVNVETIRYYQRIGLINEPAKPARGYRKYTANVVGQIHFIKRAQQLGFSLSEIAELLDIGEGHCRDIRLRAEQKRDRIAAQIRDLQALQASLDDLINACRAGNGEHACPIVETLQQHKPD